VAKYADACNLFPTPDLGRKLNVLREHCEREGRDYDSIMKTMIYQFDTGDVPRMLAQLRSFAELGIQGAIGLVKDVSTIKPLEIMGKEVIPVAAEFWK
jgi:hypothetical protein